MEEKTVALCGNPNVGKSTIFNSLTGLKQHTGNWSGKTVELAYGSFLMNNKQFKVVDLPGTYSLMSFSSEEQIARDFICFGNPDISIIVCDATCLSKNMNLVLQTLEINPNVIVCVNLIDEARKKYIQINKNELEKQLKTKVVLMSAKNKKDIELLKNEISNYNNKEKKPFKIEYDGRIEDLIKNIEKELPEIELNKRWLALRILGNDKKLILDIEEKYNINLINSKIKEYLNQNVFKEENIKDLIVKGINRSSTEICSKCISCKDSFVYTKTERKMDALLTSKKTGIPIMLILLSIIFWITIVGANIPSSMLSKGFGFLENQLSGILLKLNTPRLVHDILVLGVFRVLSWVVCVMLPPMAIFFPLFTILEDMGYLPRIAFNLDKQFQKCCTCGKQALTMCMGFGCNAAGVIGCRIINSKRERLIAIITNNFVPCNGRFPTLIAIISMFFVCSPNNLLNSIVSAMVLTMVILIGVVLTFFVSKIIANTFLKGEPSPFVLELPPYRRPNVWQVITRSIFDKTIKVLYRAIIVAIPAGIIIWCLANIQIGSVTLLKLFTNFLDPIGKIIGLDGVILTAFILAFPANEIVMPIIIMAYLSKGSLLEFETLFELKQLLVLNGWTYLTAINTMLFSLIHWPCSTTLLTIKKETGSFKWTALAFLLPTIIGFIVCFIVALIYRMVMFS